MKLQKILTGILIISAVTAFSMPAAAQRNGQGNMGSEASGKTAQALVQNQMNMRMGKGPGQGIGLFCAGLIPELNLTDDQKAEIEAILSDYREEASVLIANLKTAKLELAEVIFTNGDDEDAVRTASAAVAEYKVEMDVLRAAVITDIKALLTDDQIAILHEWEAQRLAAREVRLDSMLTGMDEWLESQAE